MEEKPGLHMSGTNYLTYIFSINTLCGESRTTKNQQWRDDLDCLIRLQQPQLIIISFTDPYRLYCRTIRTIMKTSNGNLVELQSGTTEWLKSIFFLNANEGYIVGEYGTILKTINNGTSWESLFTERPLPSVISRYKRIQGGDLKTTDASPGNNFRLANPNLFTLPAQNWLYSEKIKTPWSTWDQSRDLKFVY